MPKLDSLLFDNAVKMLFVHGQACALHNTTKFDLADLLTDRVNTIYHEHKVLSKTDGTEFLNASCSLEDRIRVFV